MKQVQDKNGRILFKQGRKIQAFAWESKTEGWCYAFGSPSTSGGQFSGKTPLTKTEALERIETALC